MKGCSAGKDRFQGYDGYDWCDGYDWFKERTDARQPPSYKRRKLEGEAQPRSVDSSYLSYSSYLKIYPNALNRTCATLTTRMIAPTPMTA
jgi:hypothetical protein